MPQSTRSPSDSLKEFMRRIRKVHFVGIGGAGMSGIADVMNTLGYQVSGSDMASNAATEQLKKSGVKVYHEHSVDNVSDVDVVVTSTAISSDNIEVRAAKPIVFRWCRARRCWPNDALQSWHRGCRYPRKNHHDFTGYLHLAASRT